MTKKKTPQPKSGKAVIYARYSSHNQREASLEQQIAECKKYAEKNGYTVSDIYQDAAVSGRTDDRPAFKRLMKDAEKEKFDYIIAWKSNRIGRNMTQTMTNMAKLAEYGVECLYTEEDFDNTASGRFALRNMMNVNQFYSENMAEDIRRGLMDNAEKCMVNGMTPLGLKRGEDGRYAIDEPTAAIVRQIFDRILHGWTITEVMTDLNNRGIKTRYGNEWKHQSFNKLLSNEQYIGVYKYSGVRIEGGIPPILDKEVFEGVQKVLGEKKRPRGKKRDTADYFLVGKVFCGKCESPMTGISGTSKTKAKHYYYACNAKHYDHTCDKKNVPKDDLEFSVGLGVKTLLQDQGLVDWLLGGYDDIIRQIREESKVSTLEGQLAEVTVSLDNIMKAMEAGAFNDVIIKRMNELADTKKDIEQAIAVETEALKTFSVDKLRENLYKFRDGDLEDERFLRDLIQNFVRRVLVFDNEIRISFYFGEEKTFPLVKREAGEIVRENVTMLHHSIISRTLLYADHVEIVTPILKRSTADNPAQRRVSGP